jgi:outer membrane protein
MLTMKVVRLISLLLVAILIPNEIKAQSDSLRKFSLKEAQAYAVQNFYGTKNAELDIEKAKKVVQETRAIGLPTISVSGSFQYTPEVSATVEQFSSLGQLGSWMYNVDHYLHNQDPTNQAFGYISDPGQPKELNPNDLKWDLSGTVTASQLIFNGSYIVGLQSAKVYKSLSEQSWAKSVQDVTEAVSNAYYNVLLARENKMILDSTYQNMTKILAETKAIAQQGLIESTDADQMQITVTNIKTSLDYITRMTDISEKLFKIQLGLSIDSNIELTDDLQPLVKGLAYENIILADFVLENNIDYQMLETQVKASELLLKLRKSEFLPVLSAYYQYYKEFNENAFSFQPPHVIGASLSIPIFASGSKVARVSQAKIDLMKAESSREQLANAIKLEYVNDKTALIAAHDKYDAATQNLKLAKRIFDNSIVKYSNGLISSTDITLIQNQYLTTQTNYYSSLQELVAATNKLEKLLTKN